MSKAEFGKDRELIPKDKIFGWYYLHLLTQDGAAINVVVHKTDIFGLRDDPRVSMSYAKRGREPKYVSGPLEKGGIVVSGGRVNLGSLLQENGMDLGFDLPITEDVRLTGEIKKTVDTVRVNDGVLFSDAETGKTSFWEVIVPHGSFEGKLAMDGQVQDIKGMAYVDRQYGSERIQDFARHWAWGHFSSPEMSIVCFDLVEKTGKANSVMVVANKNEVREIRNIEMSHLPRLARMKNPSSITEKATISSREGMDFSFDITPQNLMRQRQGEDIGTHDATYLRWSTRANLGHDTMFGITEYMRLMPKEQGDVKTPLIVLAGMSGAGKTTISRELSAKLGYTNIEFQEIYREIAYSQGFERAREWLKSVGRSQFTEGLTDGIVREIWRSENRSGFILDAVTGQDMINALRMSVPDMKISVVHVYADKLLREKRIGIRQNLPDSKAAKEERKFRDGFLIKSGVNEPIAGAEFLVRNEGTIDDSVSTLLKSLKADGIIS